jgi:hypothetical protein
VTHLIFALELMFHEAEPPQLPGQLEGREDGILGGEGDEGRARQGAIRVYPGAGVS